MKLRDRIVALRRVRASDLIANPRNWRTHPQHQRDAVGDVLAEIGFADALLVRQGDDGRLILVDGHLRAGLTFDQEVPVLVLDVTEAEADKLLLTLDPLSQMADLDRDALSSLLRQRDEQSDAIAALKDELANQAGLYSEEAAAGESTTEEIDVDGFSFSHRCKGCGFEFTPR